MNAAPPLSVVVLTYNSGRTIAFCLDALVEQTNRDFEVIVVDDASTDETLDVVGSYEGRLNLRVVRNGTHNIPHGRNIGLAESQSDIVAFVDSDDSPEPGWTQEIVAAFRRDPSLGLVSGALVPAFRTNVAEAIALNDAAIRRLFSGTVAEFCAGNCALNRRVMPNELFDEDFTAAEDLALIARVRDRYRWEYLPGLKVRHSSRESLTDYASQMYRYGLSKELFGYAFQCYRAVDFVPLGLVGASIGLSVGFRLWWPLSLIFAFSLCEAAYVVAVERYPLHAAVWSFPAWVTKNIAWSCGIVRGVARLALESDTRRLLNSKRPAVAL